MLSHAVAGNESMDRPNLQPLAEPPAINDKKIPTFKLPSLADNLFENASGQRQLYITNIIFVGNSLLDEQTLQALVQPYIKQTVTVNQLEQLRQKISHSYLDKGYINSGAILEADAFKDGILSFKILEGHITEVVIKGQEGLHESYIAKRLAGDTQQALNLPELQDRFQMLLSDPLISRMNARLLPGSSPGQSILDVDVSRAKPYQLSLLGNNQRPPSIGAEAFGVNGWVRNLTGFGDVLDFTFYTSSGSNRYTGSYSIPINAHDTQVFFRFDEGDSSVQEQPINKLNITSQVHSLEGGISHPLIHTLRQRLNFGTLLAIRENQTYLSGQPFSFVPGDSTGHTQATVLRAFQDYTQRWQDQALSLRSSFSFGLNTLGATPVQYNDFFAWLGQMQYAYRLNDKGTQWVVRGNSQFSNTALLPLERFSVGGMATVRGYRENQLVRDDGYNLTTELRYPLLEAASDQKTQAQLYLVPFIDYGKAWNLGESAQNLFSIGSGLELDWKLLHTELYYGYALIQPTLKQQSDIQDAGIHFRSRLDLF